MFFKGDIYSLAKQGSVIAGTLQHLEAETRGREEALVESFYKTEAKRFLSSSKARHPNPSLDITFFNIKDLTWSNAALGAMRGRSPSSRTHFSAAFIGHYLLVAGGAPPTSLSYQPVDSDFSRLYALDMR